MAKGICKGIGYKRLFFFEIDILLFCHWFLTAAMSFEKDLNLVQILYLNFVQKPLL